MGDGGLWMGDGGWGIGDWAQPPIPNPQSPIPNPHFSKKIKYKIIKFIKKIQNNFYNYKNENI